jgi:hypothetical protein
MAGLDVQSEYETIGLRRAHVPYERSRSIWPGVLVHALFNLSGLLVILGAPGCG